MSVHITEAIILAGGLGTRLLPVISDLPKPMADVAGKPFLAHLINYWKNQGITHFNLSVGYKKENIIAYFDRKYDGVQISYTHEDEPLGTGGGLNLALNGHVWQQSHILLLNGDTWFEGDLNILAAAADIHNNPITMSLKTIENNTRYGGVILGEDSLVKSFERISSGKTLINTGCYTIKPIELKKIFTTFPHKFSFESDALTPFAAKGLISASIQEKNFLDIGIPEDYARAENLICAN